MRASVDNSRAHEIEYFWSLKELLLYWERLFIYLWLVFWSILFGEYSGCRWILLMCFGLGLFFCELNCFYLAVIGLLYYFMLLFKCFSKFCLRGLYGFIFNLQFFRNILLFLWHSFIVGLVFLLLSNLLSILMWILIYLFSLLRLHLNMIKILLNKMRNILIFLHKLSLFV